MGTEIERKFLLAGDGWRDHVMSSRALVQGYLANANGVSVRVRTYDDLKAFITIKGGGVKLTRLEYEYEIPLEDAHELLALADPHTIVKRRHLVPNGALTWEIDVFEGQHQGLIIAELELESEEQAFDRPDWLGEEVTFDPGYHNTALAGLRAPVDPDAL